MPLQCPHCHSETVVKNGTRRLQDEPVVQSYRCRDCHRNFNERTGTPMARLRIPSNGVEFALKNRSEGIGCAGDGTDVRQVAYNGFAVGSTLSRGG